MIFGKLLPREGNFFELFNQHAQHTVTAVHAFADLVKNYGDLALRERYNRAVDDAEGAADTVTLEVNRLLHQTFITPIDREQIHSLINTMDDVADLIQDAAEAMSEGDGVRATDVRRSGRLHASRRDTRRRAGPSRQRVAAEVRPLEVPDGGRVTARGRAGARDARA